MKTQLSTLLFCTVCTLSLQAKIVPSFTETFGNGTFDHAAWEPLNAGSSVTLTTSANDRDYWDSFNDGGLLVERAVSSPGTYGTKLFLGTVSEEDVGSNLSVDFAYEKPADGFWDLKPLIAIGGRVIAEGSPVSVFSTGNDPNAELGLYSSVQVRMTGLLSKSDIGKEVYLLIQYTDGNISENRDLLLDAVNFINSGDEVEMTVISAVLSGSAASPAIQVNYERRIDKGLPALQYVWQSSQVLIPGSWSYLPAEGANIVPVNSSHERVSLQFPVDSDKAQFLALEVRNKRVGDPNVSFDESKLDPDYPQMLEWQKAGVPAGIPFRNEWPVVAVLEPTDSAGINAALNANWRDAFRNGGATIFLKNGTYTIDKTVLMKPGLHLVGESRNGVIMLITMTTQTNPQEELSAFSFDSILDAGIANLTIRGGHGTPNPSTFNNVKPDFMVTSVNFFRAYNCWVDDVNIIDSGTHPIAGWDAKNITIRGCYVDGAWNKGEQGRGYFAMMGHYWLVVDNHIRQLRHFGLQKQYCRYNVVFRNFIEQDVNFHDDDDGNNLIEANRIEIPTTIKGPSWHAVLGPWRPGGTNDHKVSRRDNFVFNNKCIEYNHGGDVTYSDSSVVYIGPRRWESDGNPFDTTDNIPIGGTFYPVVLEPEAGEN